VMSSVTSKVVIFSLRVVQAQRMTESTDQLLQSYSVVTIIMSSKDEDGNELWLRNLRVVMLTGEVENATNPVQCAS
jgi:hypothetical protein